MANAEPENDSDSNKRDMAVYRGRLAIASLWSVSATAFGFVSGPILGVLLVRSMPHRAFGNLSIALGAAGLLCTLTSLGAGAAVVQVAVSERVACGDHGVEATVRAATWLAISCTVVSVPILALLTLVFSTVNTLKGAVLPFEALWPMILLAPLTATGSALAKVLYRPRLLAAATVASSLVVASLFLLLIAFETPKDSLVALVRSIGACILVICFSPLLWHWSMRRSPDVIPISKRRLVNFGLPLLLGTVFATALAELDSVLLGVFRGSTTVGYYAPVAAIAAVVVALPGVVGSFYFPLITDLAARQDNSRVSDLYHWATRWSVTIFGPVLVLLLATPGALLKVVFGHGLGTMTRPLQILGVGVAVQLLTGFNGLTLDAYGLPKLVAIRQIVSLICTTIACLLLIPPLGVSGAALAVTLGFVVANILCSTALYSRFGVGVLDRRVAVVICGLACGLGCSRAITSLMVPGVAQLILGLSVTSLTTWTVGGAIAGREERRAIKRKFLEWRQKLTQLLTPYRMPSYPSE